MSGVKPISRRKFLSHSAALAAASALPGCGSVATEDTQGAQAVKSGLMTKAIPGTNEHLPLVGLGSPDFFYRTPEGETNDAAKALIQTMYDAGGRMIDTPAFFRPDPPVLGPILQEMDLQNELFLIGKITREAQGREAVTQRLNRMIENMGRQQLDLMLLHNLNDVENAWPVLQQAKEEGKVRYIGVSEATDRISNDVLEEFMRKYSPDFIMPSFSMYRPQIEERILPLAADMGTGVIAIEVFKTDDDGAYFSVTAGQEIPEWAQEFGCESWAQYALKYVLSHPAVTCSAVETSKPKHILDNLGAAHGGLPDQATRKRMFDHFYSLR